MSLDNVGSQGEILHLRGVRGATLGPFQVTWKDEAGVAINLTGATFQGRVFRAKSDTVLATLDITIDNALLGIFSVSLNEAGTLSLPQEQGINYSVDVTLSGVVVPLFYGFVYLRPSL